MRTAIALMVVGLTTTLIAAALIPDRSEAYRDRHAVDLLADHPVQMLLIAAGLCLLIGGVVLYERQPRPGRRHDEMP